MQFSTTLPLLLLIIFHSVPSFNVAGENTTGENPFTPKAYLIRYWKNHITNTLPKPSFLLNKASPLTASETAAFSKLANDHNALSNHLSEVCAKANLLCSSNYSTSLEKHRDNVDFSSYVNRTFNNYGTGRLDGADSFKNYSNSDNNNNNVVFDNFRRYSRGSADHADGFSAYAKAVNSPEQSFNGYGTTATGGESRFNEYNGGANVPDLGFNAYSDNSNGRKQTFAEYAGGANSGDQGFKSYGKNGNGFVNEFEKYGENSNVMGSGFRNYGQTGNGGHDTFTSYGENTNVPENRFRNYGAGGNGPVESFNRNGSNVGDDDFKSYGKKSNEAEVRFENYGQSFNGGSSTFSGYGKEAVGQSVGFKLYGLNTTFKDYAKEGVAFASYANESSGMDANSGTESEREVKWVVEPGRFFRERMLRSGSVMPMPDIRDKMPERSFLPRAIVSKLPFSTSEIGELKKIFQVRDNSKMEKAMLNSLIECERAPSAGETKRCTASIEDMIDFATTVLGQNVVVHTTNNSGGSMGNITIGQVRGINGGNVTKSVSCHQSLFPYLLYYCHSVPNVRVYEADILDPKSKVKINHGVAICHLDTSAWSSAHAAFVALGSNPGKIEVCHWIFENDMTWTLAD